MRLKTLLLSLLVILAATTKAEIASGTFGSCIWNISDEGVFTLEPEDGEAGEYGAWTTEATPWSDYAEQITSVVVKNEVYASTCANLFNGCKNMTSADLSGLRTFNAYDMSGMFSGCSSLSYLKLSNFTVYADTEIKEMFLGCDNLLRIETTDLQPSSLVEGTFASLPTKDDCFLVVPEGTKEFYAQVPGWNELGTVIDGTQYPADALALGKTGSCIWYITNEGELVIAPADGDSGTLDDWGYTAPWYEYREQITSVKFEGTVYATSCGLFFYEFDKVKSLDLTGLNTENVTNMSGMFFGCSALTTLDVTGFNTQNVTNMSGMFFGCSALTTLDVTGFNTENVTNMRDIFSGCSSLTSLDVISFDTRNVTDMSGMFGGCSGLTSLDVSSLNTENVEEMFVMFGGCSGLTSLDVSTFDTRNVTITKEMFEGCSNLTSLDLSNFNTQNVVDMSIMFAGCSGLQTLNLSNFNMQNNGQVGRMFEDCFNLTTIISNNSIPSMLKVGTFESLVNRANCTLVVPEGTKALYAAADGWNELGKIVDGTEPVGPEIPEDAIASGETGTCIWYITSEGELVIAPADGVSGDLPEEGWERDNPTPWQQYSASIYSAKIMQGVNAISCSSMFSNLEKMESIDLSNFNTQNVTNMHDMFCGCSALTSLDIRNFDTRNVTNMHGMFSGCSALTSLDIRNLDTQNVTIMNGMFSGCSSLTSLDLSPLNTENVEDMAVMFSGCSSLTTLDLTPLNTENVGEMLRMFEDCSSLIFLDLSSLNTENAASMFGMFTGCTNLTSINLTNFNMSKAAIWGYDSMFANCNNLTTIISDNETPSKLLVGTFDDLPTKETCHLLVPEGTKDLYAAADGWNELGIIDDGTPDVNPLIPADAIASGETGTCIWYITSEGELVIAPADGVSGDLPEEGWNEIQIPTGYVTDAPWGEFREEIYSARIMSGVNAVSCRIMFRGLSNMKTIDLSNFDTQNVTNMAAMFAECTSLISLDLSNFNTANVTDMDLLFAYCTNLTSLDLSNFNTENVTNMTWMFANCRSLTSLDLSHFNTQKVSVFGQMFYGCSALASLNLTNFDMRNGGWSIEMFTFCNSLNTIISDNPTPSILWEGTFKSLPTKETCQLIVPKGSEALYAVADGWKEISKFEEPLFFDETGTAMTVLSDEADLDSLIQYPENIKEVTVECPLSDKNAETIAALPNVLVIHWKVDVPVPQVIVNGMRGNEIIYVPESSQTDGTNIVRGKTASHIVFTDKQPLRITEPFFAESIEFSRNFSRTTIPGSSSGWETLVLPFEVQDIYSTQRKAFLYPFSNRDESGLHFWLARLANGSFVSAEGIAANVPYIISMPNSDMYEDAYNISGDVKFLSEDVQVQSTLGLDATSAQGYSLVPKYEDFEKKDSYAWYALNEQTYADNPVGSIFVRDTEASPFEAYLSMPTTRAQKRISISLSSFFGGATRIDDMLMKGDNDGVIYDLTGRKVKGMNQPGIYIVNGKKVLLK